MAMLRVTRGALSGKGLKNTVYWAVVTVLVLVTLVNPVLRLRTVTNAGAAKPAVVSSVPRPLPVTPISREDDATDFVDHIRPETLRPQGADAETAQLSQQAPEVTKPVEPRLAGADVEYLQRVLLTHIEHRSNTRPAKASACFVSLVRHTDEGLQRFVRLLRNVKEQLPAMAVRYPFVGFFEHGADVKHIHESIETQSGFKAGTRVGGSLPLAHVFPAGIKLEVLDEADFGRVPNFLKPEHLWAYRGHNYWGVSYRHMCRFFAVRVMFQKALDTFDYYMRLDTDSFILASPRTTGFAPRAGMPWDTAYRFYPFIAEQEHIARPAEEKDEAGIMTFNDPLHAWHHNEGSVLNRLGFAEREEEVDLFHEMASRGAMYGFSMIHPQPSPEFLVGEFEAVDEFVRKEAADQHVSPADMKYIRKGGQQGAAPSPFDAPRGLGLHFWDNLEIVDLRLFRSKPKSHPANAKRPNPHKDQRNDPADAGGAGGDDGEAGESPMKFHDAEQKRRHLQRAQIANRFLQHMDRAGGIYYHRWGDAEIRTLTMTLLLEQEEYLYLNVLPYQHYHNFHCPTTRPKFAVDVAVKPWSGERATNDMTDQSRQLLISKLVAQYRTALDGDNGVAARHEAVDEVVRALSPTRATVIDAMKSECAEQARRNYGQGSKGEGSAPMNPAETRPNNQFFWSQRWPMV